MPKSKKRSNEELLLWLKVHPQARYNQIPSGIRFAIETRFGSIKKARELAGILITDYRKCQRKSKKNINNVFKGGRPETITKEIIIEKLIELTANLGRPPKMKEINEKSCGFSVKNVSAKFGSYNAALLQAELPATYSYHEFSKLKKDIINILINIKIHTNNIPKYINIKQNDNEHIPTFYYDDLWEDVKLTRSDIEKSFLFFKKIKQKCSNYNVYYLVDDSLFEGDSSIRIINIMDFVDIVNDKYIIDNIKNLRERYDEISRKYVKF